MEIPKNTFLFFQNFHSRNPQPATYEGHFQIRGHFLLLFVCLCFCFARPLPFFLPLFLRTPPGGARALRLSFCLSRSLPVFSHPRRATFCALPLSFSSFCLSRSLPVFFHSRATFNGSSVCASVSPALSLTFFILGPLFIAFVGFRIFALAPPLFSLPKIPAFFLLSMYCT